MATSERPDHSTGELRIAVAGEDVHRLCTWLTDTPELRGKLRIVHAPAKPGTMGVPLELAVALAAATPATVAALAGAVSTWLKQRRSDVTVTLTGPHGEVRTLSAQRVSDPERLVRAFGELTEPPAGRDRAIESGRRRAGDESSA